MPDPETPDEIEGVVDAQEALGLGRDYTDQEIERAFETRSHSARGEQFWMLVKAREVAISSSIDDGSAVYTFLRRDPAVSDVASLQVVTTLLHISPPSKDWQDTVGSYDRLLDKRYEYLKERLEKLCNRNQSDVSPTTLQTVDACYHALRLRDLTEGKRWVLGPDGQSGAQESTGTGPDETGLIGGWEYSLKPSTNTEYYAYSDEDILILIAGNTTESGGGYEATLHRDGNEVNSVHHNRYGNAKRQVKKWILEVSD